MSNRIIFHVDVNNAFLSWTAVSLLRQNYPIDIRKIPSVIGGDESKRHGIVLAKSPVAKKYGIKTAETLYSARKKCSELKIFPPDYKWYYKISNEFHMYLKKFSPNILKYSIDEAFLDMSGMNYIYDNYVELAHEIKNDIKRKFGFTVNIGIANNMLCAKMASDFEKPDKVHTLFENEIEKKMWPLPVEDLFMVGKRTSEKLRKLDINTIGDLAKTNIGVLNRAFKNQGKFLSDSANGIDYSKVQKQDAKNPSISISETSSYDIDDINELKGIVFRQVDSLSRELRLKNKYCSVIAIVYKNNNFKTYSKQISLDRSVNRFDEISDVVSKLLINSWKKDPIRLIGIRFSGLSTIRKKQVSFFDSIDENNQDDSFQKMIDNINNKFGTNAITTASQIKKLNKNKKTLAKNDEMMV